MFDILLGFRPLIGVNFCKRLEKLMKLSRLRKVSVPLSGLTSVNVRYYYRREWYEVIVSVPLSGLTSVNLPPPSPYKSRPPRGFSVPKI